MKLFTLFISLVIAIFMSSTDAIAMKCNLFEQGIQQCAQRLLNVFDPVIKTFTRCSEILKKNPNLENFQTTFEVINSTYEELYKKIKDDESLGLEFLELKNRAVIKEKIEAIQNLFDGFHEALLVNSPRCQLLDHTSQKEEELQQVIKLFLSNKDHCDALAQGKIEALESFFKDGFNEFEIALNPDITNDEKFAQELQLKLNLEFMYEQENREFNARQKDEQTIETEHSIKAVEYSCEEEVIPKNQATKQSSRATVSGAKNDAEFIRDLKATINAIDITENLDLKLFKRLVAVQPTNFSRLMNREIGRARAYDVMQYNFGQHEMTSYAHYFPECLILEREEIESHVITLEGHKGEVLFIEQLRDGRLASYSDDGTIKIWDLSSNECVATLEGHKDWVRGIKQLSDGRLVSCSADNTIKVWDLKTNECVATFEGHKSCIYSVQQLHDDRLVSYSADRVIKVWDLNTRECVSMLEEHKGYTYGVQQLRDGRLASCSDDGTIKIWDLSSNECVATLEGHKDWVRGIKQLSDGRLASCSEDKTIRLWNLYPDLSFKQIALIVHLERCRQDDKVISLGDGWHEVFADMPNSLKKRFKQFVS